MRTRTILWTACLTIALLIAALVGVRLLNPLRKPSDSIRASLFEYTPLGSHRQRIDALARARGWETTTEMQPGVRLEDDLQRIGADNFLYATVGHYRDGFRTTFVSAVWFFNRDADLVEIKVWKTVYSP